MLLFNKKYYIITITILLAISIALCISCIYQRNKANQCDEYVYMSINNAVQTTNLLIEEGDYQSVIPMMSVMADCAVCYSDNTKGHMLSDMINMYIEDMDIDIEKKDDKELSDKIASINVINSYIYNGFSFDEINSKIKEFIQ